jgi:hypothetical protein
MSKSELRIIDFSLFNNKDFMNDLNGKKEYFSTISFGSESCYRQLPSVDIMNKIIKSLEGCDRKFIVPTVYETHFDLLVRYLDMAINNKVEYLCINDFGTLNFIHREYKDDVPNIVLGPGLIYSYEYVPWHEHFLENDPEYLEKCMSRCNIDNDWSYSFLKEFFGKFNFGIELAGTPGIMQSIDPLREHGFEVNVIADLIPVSYTRCCHTAKFYHKTPQTCGRPCRSMLCTERTHRWHKGKHEVVEIPDGIRKIIPKLYVWGNATYNLSNNEDIKLRRDDIDQIIFYQRFYESLDSIVEKQKILLETE